ncbi:MAG: hypothetical protein ABI576_15000 [Flavobacterium sp.]
MDFRYSQKKLDSFQTDLFFHKTYSMASNAEDLYQYVVQTFLTPTAADACT